MLLIDKYPKYPWQHGYLYRVNIDIFKYINRRALCMEHTQIAKELFSRKFYCSQAVLAAFAEELGMTTEQALKVGACFGGVYGGCVYGRMVL